MSRMNRTFHYGTFNVLLTNTLLFVNLISMAQLSLIQALKQASTELNSS